METPLQKLAPRNRDPGLGGRMPGSPPPPLSMAPPHETHRRAIWRAEPWPINVWGRNEGTDAEISTYSNLQRDDQGGANGAFRFRCCQRNIPTGQTRIHGSSIFPVKGQAYPSILPYSLPPRGYSRAHSA